MDEHNFTQAKALTTGSTEFSAATTQSPVLPSTRTLTSRHDFDTLVTRVEAAIAEQKMGLIARASASAGAAGRGIKILGNAVLMVFRNDYAVRMLQASVPAGIEAPIRLYVTENSDGSASLSYRSPSAVFAPYQSEKLNKMAAELDPIFERIVQVAVNE
jgi:uncharacterized protein (DUF302 family)